MSAGKSVYPQNQLVFPIMREIEARHEPFAAEVPLLSARSGGGIIALVLVVLAGSLGAFTLLSAESSEPLLLTLMAFLATLGVFFLFGLVAGYVRIAEQPSDSRLFRALARNFEDGLCITNLEGRRVYSNRVFDELVGPSEYDHVSALESLVAGEPQAAEALFRLARAASRGESRTEEFRLRSVSNGQRQSRWFRLSVMRLDMGRKSEGAPYVLWRLMDITDQRRREAEATRALEASLSFYEAMPIGLMVASEDATIEHLNGTLATWLGLSASSLARGLVLTDIISGDGAMLLRALARDATNGAGRIDLDLVREDGRSWPATLLVVPRGEGGFLAAVLERLADEEPGAKGSTAEVRFARFFQSAPFGIATVTADGRINRANAAFARLVLDGKAGKADMALDVLTRNIDSERRAQVQTALEKAIAGKANIQPLEITVGESREFTRRVFFSTLARGSADEAAVLYVIDTTELKALEQQFAQSQKMEAVGKLAGGVAHDFNNVLTAIIGYSDLLLQTHRPSDPAYKNIMNIKTSANRAAGLVRQLLAFSRRQTLQPEVLQVNEVLTETAVMLRPTIGEKIDLKVEPGRDLWYVKADRSQLQSVLVNLAVNARDAMPDGGQLIIRSRNVTERESQRLQPQTLPMGEYVLIEVEDTGHGMPPEVQAKIFEPFFTTKSMGKGTGLGLAMVYGIVKQTGGYIFVHSTPGEGTTFRIFLPRHFVDAETEAELANGKAKKERQADLTGAGRVLLVEDEDAVRSFAVEALKRQGYEVLEASSGAEAIDMVKEADKPIDIVISDVIMPEMDGPSMYKELRKTNPKLKIIFMSGYADDAFKNAMDPDERFAFLQKPFSLAQLAAKVKEELGR
ncbi:MAG: PAS domain-containing sensor histidine kinase [Proteobacteria bacterium]|nr:MAG: PAS domain-containing sensor histidine kinase [Pseudomonadota bacterium]